LTVLAFAAGGAIGNRDAGASSRLGATVFGTSIGIVARGRLTGLACAAGAEVRVRAGQAIVTRQGVIRIEAPHLWSAGIIGADVTVVTEHWDTAATRPFVADFIGGAFVSVITRRFVIDVQTANFKIAIIIGTDILVVTIGRFPGFALPCATGIILGTGIAIIAGIAVGDKGATTFRLAGIVRTQVSIVAGQGSCGNALAQMAVVTRGADVRVVARSLIQGVDTALLRVARIGGANVVVIAAQCWPSFALAIGALVIEGTGIAIIAIARLRFKETPNGLVTRVQRTAIAVVANQGSRPDTSAQ
jgi:hypothetical protein